MYTHMCACICILYSRNGWEDKHCLEFIQRHFCYNTCFQMQICSKAIDISGNSVNIMQISYLLILILSARNGRKLHSAGWSPLGIHKTHTLTHLNYLPATSVHHTCCEPHPPTSGDTTLFWFQITLLPRVHTNSQATTLPMVTSGHFQGKVSYLF